jgi:hypothetical protein
MATGFAIQTTSVLHVLYAYCSGSGLTFELCEAPRQGVCISAVYRMWPKLDV